MAGIEENFYELYKNERDKIIILKECESEDEDKKSASSFDSEDFDIEDEKNEDLKKTESKASTLDEPLEKKSNLKSDSDKKF